MPVLIIALFLAVTVGCEKAPASRPVFITDLHAYGFNSKASGQAVGVFTDINFLSNDLVLVTINQKVYGPVEPSFTDRPPSKLLLFDLLRRALVATLDLPIEKNLGSVKATQNGQFVLLDEAGLRLCSGSLECGSPRPALGPLLVSPKGTRLVVGGNAQTGKKLLDSSSLNELESFSPANSKVIPGDNLLLVRRNSSSVGIISPQLYLRLPGKPDYQLGFGGADPWPDARFLSDNVLTYFESDHALAVAKIDGTILYRLPVRTRWRLAEITTSTSGSRFCFHEAGYTSLNAVLNFQDFDSGRPYNFESVKIVETNSGKLVFELEWDPRPYISYILAPALSPDGRKVALIRSGILQIFEVP